MATIGRFYACKKDGALWYSEDRGSTWSLDTDITPSTSEDDFVDVTEANGIQIALFQKFTSPYNLRIYRRTNTTGWAQVFSNTSSTPVIGYVFNDGTYFYVYEGANGEVQYKSDADGLNWTLFTFGVNPSQYAKQVPGTIGFDGKVVGFNTIDGKLRSWTPNNASITVVNELVPTVPQSLTRWKCNSSAYILAFTDQSKFYYSTNDGTTINSINLQTINAGFSIGSDRCWIWGDPTQINAQGLATLWMLSGNKIYRSYFDGIGNTTFTYVGLSNSTLSGTTFKETVRSFTAEWKYSISYKATSTSIGKKGPRAITMFRKHVSNVISSIAKVLPPLSFSTTSTTIADLLPNKTWNQILTTAISETISSFEYHLYRFFWQTCSAVSNTTASVRKNITRTIKSTANSISSQLSPATRMLTALCSVTTISFNEAYDRTFRIVCEALTNSVGYFFGYNTTFRISYTAISHAYASRYFRKFWSFIWSMLFTGTKWIGVKSNTSTSVTSVDGENWVTNSLPITETWTSITNTGTTSVAIARDSDKIVKSLDGVNWTSVILPNKRHYTSICSGNTQLVAVALDSDKVIRSIDEGVTWVEHSIPYGNWTSIAWNGDLFCAVNGEGKSATSYDGVTWVEHTMPDNLQYNCVTWALGQFTAVASGPTNKAAVSTNGIDWTRITMPSSQNWTSVGPGVGNPDV